MSQIKYHKKSKLLFAAEQSAEGTVATIAAADAIAIFDADYSTELASETFQYTGSELDRDEGVTINDRFSKANGDTFVPAGGAVATGQPASDSTFILAKMFRAAGGNVTYDAGTGVNAKATVSNSVSENTLLTLDVCQESSADAANQNVFRFYDVRANVDLDMAVGSRAKLKWNFQGNSYNALPAHINDYPFSRARIAPNYGTQKTVIMPSVRQANIDLAELKPLGTAFAGGTTKNVSFSKLEAPNVFGFEYGRFLSADEEGFDKGAVATDVMLTILSPKADATFIPEKMLEGFYHFQFQWSDKDGAGVSVPGSIVKIVFSKLQAMNIANSTIGNYQAKTITFRNTGTTDFIFS